MDSSSYGYDEFEIIKCMNDEQSDRKDPIHFDDHNELGVSAEVHDKGSGELMQTRGDIELQTTEIGSTELFIDEGMNATITNMTEQQHPELGSCLAETQEVISNQDTAATNMDVQEEIVYDIHNEMTAEVHDSNSKEPCITDEKAAITTDEIKEPSTYQVIELEHIESDIDLSQEEKLFPPDSSIGIVFSETPRKEIESLAEAIETMDVITGEQLQQSLDSDLRMDVRNECTAPQPTTETIIVAHTSPHSPECDHVQLEDVEGPGSSSWTHKEMHESQHLEAGDVISTSQVDLATYSKTGASVVKLDNAIDLNTSVPYIGDSNISHGEIVSPESHDTDSYQVFSDVDLEHSFQQYEHINNVPKLEDDAMDIAMNMNILSEAHTGELEQKNINENEATQSDLSDHNMYPEIATYDDANQQLLSSSTVDIEHSLNDDPVQLISDDMEFSPTDNNFTVPMKADYYDDIDLSRETKYDPDHKSLAEFQIQKQQFETEQQIGIDELPTTQTVAMVEEVVDNAYSAALLELEVELLKGLQAEVQLSTDISEDKIQTDANEIQIMSEQMDTAAFPDPKSEHLYDIIDYHNDTDIPIGITCHQSEVPIADMNIETTLNNMQRSCETEEEFNQQETSQVTKADIDTGALKDNFDVHSSVKIDATVIDETLPNIYRDIPEHIQVESENKSDESMESQDDIETDQSEPQGDIKQVVSFQIDEATTLSLMQQTQLSDIHQHDITRNGESYIAKDMYHIEASSMETPSPPVISEDLQSQEGIDISTFVATDVLRTQRESDKGDSLQVEQYQPDMDNEHSQQQDIAVTLEKRLSGTGLVDITATQQDEPTAIDEQSANEVNNDFSLSECDIDVIIGGHNISVDEHLVMGDTEMLHRFDRKHAHLLALSEELVHDQESIMFDSRMMDENSNEQVVSMKSDLMHIQSMTEEQIFDLENDDKEPMQLHVEKSDQINSQSDRLKHSNDDTLEHVKAQTETQVIHVDTDHNARDEWFLNEHGGQKYVSDMQKSRINILSSEQINVSFEVENSKKLETCHVEEVENNESVSEYVETFDIGESVQDSSQTGEIIETCILDQTYTQHSVTNLTESTDENWELIGQGDDKHENDWDIISNSIDNKVESINIPDEKQGFLKTTCTDEVDDLGLTEQFDYSKGAKKPKTQYTSQFHSDDTHDRQEGEKEVVDESNDQQLIKMQEETSHEKDEKHIDAMHNSITDELSEYDVIDDEDKSLDDKQILENNKTTEFEFLDMMISDEKETANRHELAAIVQAETETVGTTSVRVTESIPIIDIREEEHSLEQPEATQEELVEKLSSQDMSAVYEAQYGVVEEMTKVAILDVEPHIGMETAYNAESDDDVNAEKETILIAETTTFRETQPTHDIEVPEDMQSLQEADGTQEALLEVPFIQEISTIDDKQDVAETTKVIKAETETDVIVGTTSVRETESIPIIDIPKEEQRLEQPEATQEELVEELTSQDMSAVDEAQDGVVEEMTRVLILDVEPHIGSETVYKAGSVEDVNAEKETILIGETTTLRETQLTPDFELPEYRQSSQEADDTHKALVEVPFIHEISTIDDKQDVIVVKVATSEILEPLEVVVAGTKPDATVLTTITDKEVAAAIKSPTDQQTCVMEEVLVDEQIDQDISKVVQREVLVTENEFVISRKEASSDIDTSDEQKPLEPSNLIQDALVDVQISQETLPVDTEQRSVEDEETNVEDIEMKLSDVEIDDKPEDDESVSAETETNIIDVTVTSTEIEERNVIESPEDMEPDIIQVEQADVQISQDIPTFDEEEIAIDEGEPNVQILDAELSVEKNGLEDIPTFDEEENVVDEDDPNVHNLDVELSVEKAALNELETAKVIKAETETDIIVEITSVRETESIPIIDIPEEEQSLEQPEATQEELVEELTSQDISAVYEAQDGVVEELIKAAIMDVEPHIASETAYKAESVEDVKAVNEAILIVETTTLSETQPTPDIEVPEDRQSSQEADDTHKALVEVPFIHDISTIDDKQDVIDVKVATSEILEPLEVVVAGTKPDATDLTTITDKEVTAAIESPTDQQTCVMEEVLVDEQIDQDISQVVQREVLVTEIELVISGKEASSDIDISDEQKPLEPSNLIQDALVEVQISQETLPVDTEQRSVEDEETKVEDIEMKLSDVEIDDKPEDDEAVSAETETNIIDVTDVTDIIQVEQADVQISQDSPTFDEEEIAVDEGEPTVQILDVELSVEKEVLDELEIAEVIKAETETDIIVGTTSVRETESIPIVDIREEVQSLEQTVATQEDGQQNVVDEGDPNIQMLDVELSVEKKALDELETAEVIKAETETDIIVGTTSVRETESIEERNVIESPEDIEPDIIQVEQADVQISQDSPTFDEEEIAVDEGEPTVQILDVELSVEKEVLDELETAEVIKAETETDIGTTSVRETESIPIVDIREEVQSLEQTVATQEDGQQNVVDEGDPNVQLLDVELSVEKKALDELETAEVIKAETETDIIVGTTSVRETESMEERNVIESPEDIEPDIIQVEQADVQISQDSPTFDEEEIAVDEGEPTVQILDVELSVEKEVLDELETAEVIKAETETDIIVGTTSVRETESIPIVDIPEEVQSLEQTVATQEDGQQNVVDEGDPNVQMLDVQLPVENKVLDELETAEVIKVETETDIIVGATSVRETESIPIIDIQEEEQSLEQPEATQEELVEELTYQDISAVYEAQNSVIEEMAKVAILDVQPHIGSESAYKAGSVEDVNAENETILIVETTTLRETKPTPDIEVPEYRQSSQEADGTQEAQAEVQFIKDVSTIDDKQDVVYDKVVTSEISESLEVVVAPTVTDITVDRTLIETDPMPIIDAKEDWELPIQADVTSNEIVEDQITQNISNKVTSNNISQEELNIGKRKEVAEERMEPAVDHIEEFLHVTEYDGLVVAGQLNYFKEACKSLVIPESEDILEEGQEPKSEQDNQFDAIVIKEIDPMRTDVLVQNQLEAMPESKLEVTVIEVVASGKPLEPSDLIQDAIVEIQISQETLPVDIEQRSVEDEETKVEYIEMKLSDVEIDDKPEDDEAVSAETETNIIDVTVTSTEIEEINVIESPEDMEPDIIQVEQPDVQISQDSPTFDEVEIAIDEGEANVQILNVELSVEKKSLEDIPTFDEEEKFVDEDDPNVQNLDVELPVEKEVIDELETAEVIKVEAETDIIAGTTSVTETESMPIVDIREEEQSLEQPEATQEELVEELTSQDISAVYEAQDGVDKEMAKVAIMDVESHIGIETAYKAESVEDVKAENEAILIVETTTLRETQPTPDIELPEDRQSSQEADDTHRSTCGGTIHP